MNFHFINYLAYDTFKMIKDVQSCEAVSTLKNKYRPTSSKFYSVVGCRL